MYQRDPRRYWTPTIARHFHIEPWSMYDLTPSELDALLAHADAANTEII